MILTFKNKRINEIASQCGLYIDPDNQKVSSAEVEFFVEKIIEECARVDSELNNPDHADGDFNQGILGHFGVVK